MFQHYYQKPGHAIAAGMVLSVVDIIVVGLRFWLRRRQRLPLRSDDWLMIPATLMTLGIGIDLVYGVSQGALAYPTKVPPDAVGHVFKIVTDQLTLANKVKYAFSILFVLAIGSIKASVLFFYLRIFSFGKSHVRVILISLIILVAIWTTFWLFESIFLCGLDFWNAWGTTQDLITKCINWLHAELALCITDFVIDILIIAMPVPLIWRLKLSTGKKIVASGIFLLGAVTVAASLTRLVITVRALAGGWRHDGDEILAITLYLYWGMVECGVGIIAACLPTLTFLFSGLTWESVVTTARRLSRYRLKSGFTNLENDSLQMQSFNDTENQKTTIIVSASTASSSMFRVPATIGDEPFSGPESYIMQDIARTKVLV
ncbi:plasma membrane protein Pth11-like protein [Jackrogersella minutella]|nr:plasma membrane protein Pth11-like protein [Jackrogersella minutella]